MQLPRRLVRLSLMERIGSLQPVFLMLMRLRSYFGKYVFLTVCIAALIGYSLYVRVVIGQLQVESINVTQTYAELIRTAITENMNYEEMNVIFEEIIRKSGNPIIITDTTWRPIMWKNISTGCLWWHHELLPGDTTFKSSRIAGNTIPNPCLSVNQIP
jgi:hypothetical protein